MKKKNSITCIGFLGIQRCYVNIPEKEAIERYKKSENVTDEEIENHYRLLTFEFDEEFGVYDIWGDE